MKKLKSKTSPLFRSIRRQLYPYFLILLLLVSGNSIFAQSSGIDSSKNALQNTASEPIGLKSGKVNELKDINLNAALTAVQKAMALAQQTGDKAQEAEALNKMGHVLYETEDRPSSLSYFEKSERLAKELGLLRLQSINLMSIAKYHRYVSKDSTKTVNNLLKSAEVSKVENHNWCTGRSYAKLASFYTKYSQLNLCKTYLDLAAKYYLQLDDGALAMAHYYNEIGEKIWDKNPKKAMDFFLKGMEYSDIPNLKVSLAKAYNFIGDHEKALNYIKEAIPSFRKKKKAKRMLGVAIAQLAEIYIEQGDYSAANKACDEGIDLLSNLGRGDRRAIPVFYRLKGIIAENEGNDKIALEYYTQSLNEAINIKFSFERIKSRLAIGGFYALRDQNKSKTFCNKSLKEAQNALYTNLEIDACNCLYKIYKSEASFVDALKYHEQKILLNDSLNTLKVKHALDINSKIAEKNNLLAEQFYQKEIKDKEFKSQNIFIKSLLVITILSLLLIAFLTFSYRRIRRQNKEINKKTNELETVNQRLEQSNEELERFAHIASHDLKSPLRNIISYTGLLRRNLNHIQKPIIKDSLDFIEKNGKRMNWLIEDVLEFSKLSNGDSNEKNIVQLNELINEISQLSESTLEDESLISVVSDLPTIEWNSSKLFLLFKNIIENGLKYNDAKKTKIKIYSTHTANRYAIYIEDNGIGIEKEYFDKIFIMFQRLHNQGEYEGTGLGLATCKKIVEEFEGSISVDSELGKGTTFKIEFPAHLIRQPKEMEFMEEVELALQLQD